MLWKVKGSEARVQTGRGDRYVLSRWCLGCVWVDYQLRDDDRFRHSR